MIETQGCEVVLRRIEGPAAKELFFSCAPPGAVAEPGAQTEAIYRAIQDVLASEGASFSAVVSESIFLRDAGTDTALVRAARERVLAERGSAAHRPAQSEIEQPPLTEPAALEVLVHAVVPHAGPLRAEVFEVRSGCGCAECARMHGLRVRSDGEDRLHAGALCGQGADAYEQTLAMFGVAEDLLRQAGMEFRDVVRTWIHLREMERDYDDLNRARRAFFEARAIDPVPASTGIGGGPVSREHDLCLGIYAVKPAQPLVRVVMTSPTLNEAGTYGADFVRGSRVEEANKTALYVSGTASIDEAGRTAHPGDFESQADRMLVNVAALLEGQGATFGDVVSAITYLKHPADAARLRRKLHDAGFEGFPNVLVAAPICRPDLLCETEVVAVRRTPTR